MSERTTIWVSKTTKKLIEKINRDLKLGCKSNDAVLQKLLNIAFQFKELKDSVRVDRVETEDESVKCVNRIFHDGVYWCVNKPPKMVKLPTLDICRVCKQRKFGLKEGSKVESARKQNFSWRQNPRRGDLQKAGMIYCSREGGLWVFPSKCEHCKHIDCPYNPKNPKKKMEQEAEKYGKAKE